MRVLFLQRAATWIGGAERIVHDSAVLLEQEAVARGRPVETHLLYDPTVPPDPAFLRAFRTAFPWADLPGQIAALDPQVIYLHQVEARQVQAVAASHRPSVRFLHDHAPFCLRRHKYTTLGQQTCTRPLGPHCWPCLGFLERRAGVIPVGIRSLSQARRELQHHRGLTALAVGSLYMKDHVVMHGFPPASVVVLPLFVEPPPPLQESALRNPDRLVFLGALTRGKGLDLLLRALAGLPREVRLEVIGTGPQEPWLRGLCRHLGLETRVDWLGSLPRERVEERIRRALCLVMPSREPETFGLVGLEAFRQGTPVITSRAGGVGEWLLEGETGLAFSPCEVPDLIRAIQEMRRDPDRAREMGRAGWGLLQQHFRPADHARALWDLLEAVAIHAGGRP